MKCYNTYYNIEAVSKNGGMNLNKDILRDYIDACELIKETEEDIRRLHKKETVYDKVRGSNPDFPYQIQSFSVTGIVETALDKSHLEKEEELLQQRIDGANQIKRKVEGWMNTIPVRMQRIIRYRIFERLSWEEVAINMGRNSTENGVRKEFERFMKNI